VGVIEPVARAVGAVAHEGVETLLRPGHAAELAAAVIDDGQRSPSRRWRARIRPRRSTASNTSRIA
jgi:hypothetical protein